MWKRIIAMVLCTSMLLTAAVSVSADHSEGEAADAPLEEADGASLEETADSGYTLAIDEETCTVSVLNQDGETLLSSNPTDPAEDAFTAAATLNNLRSQLIVRYYDDKSVDATIGSYLSSIQQGTFTITQKEDTIRVDYDFSRKNEQFIIPVEYSLSGSCFRITVLTDEIEEYGEKKINKIMVAPYMVRGTAEEEGYLLLPDGSGARVDFSYVNPYASAYSAQIYGRNLGESLYYEEGNPQQIILPVFGADYGDYGVLARVDGNPSAGFIEAECVGGDSSYAHAYASYAYRIFNTVTITGQDWQYKEYVAESEVVETEDFSVAYYITENGGLMSLAEKCREIMELPKAPAAPLTGALYAYGATTQREAFLGIPYTKTLKATTFEDIADMLDCFTEENQSLAVFLQDFESSALKGKYPSGIKWSRYSGGAKDFEGIMEEYGQQHSFYSVQNLMYEKCTSFLWAKQSRYATMVSKDNLARYTYSPVTYAGTRTDLFGLNLSRLLSMAGKSLTKARSSECGVALQYLGTELYGDYSRSGGASRNQFAQGIRTLMETYGEGGKLAVDGGNEYAMGYGAVNYNFPVSSSGLDIETESVPFAQLVYHGSVNMVSSAVNMTEDPKRELLLCVASGTVPCFAVTGMSNMDLRRSGYKDLFHTEFEQQQEEISAFFDETTEYYNKIYDQSIVSYQCDGKVSVTVYENGITAMVNYSDEAAVCSGHVLEPFDFTIIY